MLNQKKPGVYWVCKKCNQLRKPESCHEKDGSIVCEQCFNKK